MRTNSLKGTRTFELFRLTFVAILAGFSLILFCEPAFAQPSQAQQNAINQQLATERATRDARKKANEDQIDQQIQYGNQVKQSVIYRQQILQNYAHKFYRRPTERESAVINIDPTEEPLKEDLSGNSGAFRLLQFVKCGGGSDETPEIRSHCLKFSMPGNGSSYSFRALTYRISRLADLSIDESGQLKAGSTLTISFLVDLGTPALNELQLTSPGVKILSEYKAPVLAADVRSDWEGFDREVTVDGFTFGRRLRINLEHTYALRTVAYKGTSLQEAWGEVFNELDFDKRSDKVIVFKIRAANDGNGYIVAWRSLRDQPSPKYKK